MEIRAVDPKHPEATGFFAAHDVCRDAALFGRPWASFGSPEERLAELRHEDPGYEQGMDAAWDGDTVVGAGMWWRPLTDNTHMTYVGACVPPERRRRGIGTAVVQHLIADAHRAGRPMILADVLAPDAAADHPYRAFARSLGFRLGNTEIVRHLRLPVAAEVLDRLDRDSREHYGDRYTIEVHVNGVPDDLRPSLCAAYNRLATDAPSGAIEFEEESVTPERYALDFELLEETGATRLTAVALTADREVAAYSDLMLPKSQPDRVHQWGTLVTAPHRGHRLGTAVKVANLRLLQKHHPDRKLVETSNAETNRYMVSINEALGFEIVEVMDSLYRDDSSRLAADRQ